MVDEPVPGSNNCHCVYRGPGGRRCAAGWLIPDDMYSPQMEGASVLEATRGVPGLLTALAVPLWVVECMQTAHDRAGAYGAVGPRWQYWLTNHWRDQGLPLPYCFPIPGGH